MAFTKEMEKIRRIINNLLDEKPLPCRKKLVLVREELYQIRDNYSGNGTTTHEVYFQAGQLLARIRNAGF